MIGAITMDEIVNAYLDAEEVPDSLYRRIHGLGVRAYRQIYMHATGQPIPVELEVLANKTAILPCDCLNKISVGTLNAKGQISPFTEDGGLGLGDATNVNRLGQPTQDITINQNAEIYYNPNGTYVGSFLGGQYGSGARSDLGFYRMDWEQRLIIFDFQFPYTSVWMEYLPVFTDDGQYNVSPFFVEAILSFIEWKDKRNGASDRANAERQWGNQFRIGRRSMKPFDASQVFLSYNRTTRQGRF